VPFGEFVPFRSWFPALGKVVPLDDTWPGIWDALFSLTLTNGKKLSVGPLICYEDIFPQLARAETAKGADFFVVLTNDAWYGTEGGATQHAAHSVLRAVENRRPLLRCGNDGWSGWIDEFGFARALEQSGGPNGKIALDPSSGEDLTTYFRGVGVFKMYRDRDFDGTESFYVRHGDWFVALSGLLAAAGAVGLRRPRDYKK
jgi:apolipoprotein N-acyltransferase